MKIFELKRIIEQELQFVYSKTEMNVVVKQIFKKFLNLSQLEILTRNDLDVSTFNSEIVLSAVSRLKTNEPLDYVIGEIEFLDLKLWVNSSVLIPRPETEDLINIALGLYENKKQPKYIADVGTGSGCIALSLKKFFSESEVLAFDVSEAALKTAEYNSMQNELSVNFVQFDVLGSEDLPLNKGIDLLVSNPPYVLYNEIEEMHPRVYEFEPEIALFTSLYDDLQYYRVLKDYVLRFLADEGVFIFEFNSKLNKEMINLFSDLEDYIVDLQIHKDCFGKNRFISGRRKVKFNT